MQKKLVSLCSQLYRESCIVVRESLNKFQKQTPKHEQRHTLKFQYIQSIGLFLTGALLLINTSTFAQEGKLNMSDQANTIVFETNQGNIEIKLFPEIAPKACENIIGLIKKDYYNGIIFHRVIKNFMIQGGDPTGTGRGGESIWGQPFEDEVTDSVTFDKKGILAMANSGPNTNGSQFFITTAATTWLNGNHTIFGEVISGYDTVEKIENTKVGAGDKPVEKQKIIKAYVK